MESPPAQRPPAQRPPARHPLYRLRITKWGAAYSIFSTLVLLVLYVGLGLLPIWTTLAKGSLVFDDGALFSRDVLQATGFSFAVASFFLIPTLYIFTTTFIAGSVRSAQPCAWTFTETTIRVRVRAKRRWWPCAVKP